MPLKEGANDAVVSENISEMMHSTSFGSGKNRKKKHMMAIAAALRKAGKSKYGKKGKKK